MGLQRAIFGPNEKEKQEMIEDVRDRVANGKGALGVAVELEL